MSTLVAKNLQVGDSGTPTNNFTIYQPPVPDGGLHIATGNSGSVTDVLKLTNSGNMELTGNISTAGQFLSPYSFRNKIINGGMLVDQNSAGNETYISTAGTGFIVDRFFIYTKEANVVAGSRYIGRSESPEGHLAHARIYFKNAHRAPQPTDEITFQQDIEDYNVLDLLYGTANAKPITVSFWVMSNKTGSHALSVRNYSRLRSYVTSYTISSPGVWEYKTITIPGDAGNGATSWSAVGHLNICFTLLAGSTLTTSSTGWMNGNYARLQNCVNLGLSTSDYIRITGVQVEAGTVATPFDQRPFNVEFAMCQRYFQRHNSISDTGIKVFNQTVIRNVGNYDTWFGGKKLHPVPMRVPPSAGFINYISGFTGLANFAPYPVSDGYWFGVRLGNTGEILADGNINPYFYCDAVFNAEL